jgi:addiction module RelE/StbE family toxin
MELFWTTEAIQDRDNIYDYIEADNPAAALALDELIAQKTARLVAHPLSGKQGRVTGTYELIAHPNYVLVYDVVGTNTDISCAAHVETVAIPIDHYSIKKMAPTRRFERPTCPLGGGVNVSNKARNLVLTHQLINRFYPV